MKLGGLVTLDESRPKGYRSLYVITEPQLFGTVWNSGFTMSYRHQTASWISLIEIHSTPWNRRLELSGAIGERI